MQTKSIEKMKQRSAAALEESIAKLEQENRIIELLSSSPNAVNLPEPKYIHSGKLFGSAGSINWKDATPEQAVAIMEAFPPVPSGLDRGRAGTSYKPEAEVKEGDRATFTLGCGYSLKIERHSHNMGETSVNWYAMLGSDLMRFDVELLAIHGVTPTLHGNVESYPGGGPVKRISNVKIAWGDKVNPSHLLRHVRYSQGSPEYWNQFLVWAEYGSESPILELISDMAAECYERRQHSKQAYQEDKAKGLTPEPASPYSAPGMRTGTEAQHNCLETEEARKDRALAKAHWFEYVADSDPDSWPVGPSEYRNYFDHYTWACRWLALHDLHTDPNGPDGKPYKYGHGWL